MISYMISRFVRGTVGGEFEKSGGMRKKGGEWGLTGVRQIAWVYMGRGTATLICKKARE